MIIFYSEKGIVDYAVKYSLPATCDAVTPSLGSDGVEILILHGRGAPSTNYAAVMNGSEYNDHTNSKTYKKFGTYGLATGTWTALN